MLRGGSVAVGVTGRAARHGHDGRGVRGEQVREADWFGRHVPPGIPAEALCNGVGDTRGL